MSTFRPMTPGFCRWMLHKVLGWTDDAPVTDGDKAIILGVPHTSIWDFAIGYLYYRSYGRRMKVMIKKEAFFWPVSWLLRSMGGFPVNRGHSSDLIVSLIHEMKRDETFHLVICPEGTRKPVRKWKTGYHTIATQTGVPVYLGYFDWGAKHVGITGPVELTGDARADTDRIQRMYEDMHLTGKHPEMFVTH